MRRFVMAALVLTATATAGAQTAQLITLAEAKKALEAAEAAATKMGVGMGCVVLDARGAVVASIRMDKAAPFAPDAARGKAVISASFGAPSGSMAQLGASGIGAILPGSPVWLQGALPITRNKVTIGAIGCGGGTGQQDEDSARAGVATLQ